MPLVPANTSVQSVLSSIAGKYEVVRTYSAADTGDPWKMYDVSAPSYANDLTDIDNTRGIWIRMSSPGTLTVSGTMPNTTSISLSPGWNLIGYPAQTSREVATALSSINGKYASVWGYNAADTGDPLKVYDVVVPSYVNDLTQLQPGWGYWVNMNTSATLVVNK